jgi:hypothetical protein
VAGRPSAIVNLQETDNDGKRNWLIYGDSGVGKTVLAGTCADSDHKGLLIMAEAAGSESAKAFGSVADEWVVETWEDLQAAFDYMKADGHKVYDWCVVDSLTEMEQLCFEYTLRKAHEANSNRSLDIPAVQDYQTVYIREQKLVDAFNRLPVNMLYTAQPMRLGLTDEDDDDYDMLLPLMGSTKNGVVAQKVCGKVTLVGYLEARVRSVTQGEGESAKKTKVPFRRLYTQKTQRMFAKDRHDTFGEYIDDPNIIAMNEAVEARIAQGARGTAKSTAKKSTAGRTSK